jgi:hypothetical protein
MFRADARQTSFGNDFPLPVAYRPRGHRASAVSPAANTRNTVMRRIWTAVIVTFLGSLTGLGTTHPAARRDPPIDHADSCETAKPSSAARRQTEVVEHLDMGNFA